MRSLLGRVEDLERRARGLGAVVDDQVDQVEDLEGLADRMHAAFVEADNIMKGHKGSAATWDKKTAWAHSMLCLRESIGSGLLGPGGDDVSGGQG